MKEKEKKEQEEINSSFDNYDMSFEDEDIIAFAELTTQMTDKMQRLFEFSIKLNQLRAFNVLHSK